MRDVAEAVGMSPMTVSRALRDDDTVSNETRKAVREAADRLGYVYDTTAQAFRTRRSGFVAVTLPSINNANFADTFRSLSDALSSGGLQVLLGSTNYRVEREEELVRQLLARNPEALVLTGGSHTETTRDLVRSRGLPVIEMWDLPPDPLGHSVGFSNTTAMRDVVRHLKAEGRQKLAFVGAAAGADLRGAARRAGVVAEAEALGLPEVQMIDIGPAPVSMRQSAQTVSEIGRDIAKFDALVCVSDPVAFGCLTACQRLGLLIPRDLAITGFGCFDVAQVSNPRITSVNVNARQIGSEVAALLEQILGDNPKLPPMVVDVGTQLIPGETS